MPMKTGRFSVRRLLRWEATLAAAGVGLLLGAGWVAAQPEYVTPRPAGVVPGGPSIAPSGSASVMVGNDEPTPAPPSDAANGRVRARPLRLSLPAQQITAPIEPVGILPDDTLAVPNDPHVVGWWRDGAAPGEAGTVVIDGHVDTAHAGPGALFHLDSLPMGSLVVVQTTRGDFRYQVVGRRVYPKGDLPPTVFDQQTTQRLVLITCGGPFDRRTHHYADNVVVYAIPVKG
ncbi:MAG: class F sortase [Acidothermus sp.]|nr:class F sortase [Acidothermus sp.]